MDVKVGEKLKFTFQVKNEESDDDGPSTIAEFIYDVVAQGLRGASDNCRSEVIELFSWQSVEKPFTLNYDGTPSSFLSKALQSKSGTAQKFSARQTLYGSSNLFGKSKSMFGGASKMILEGIVLEMELRTSDIQALNSKGQIETCIARVNFDRDNMMDLLIARDLTENASFEVSNVSTDKRALKETRKFYLNEVDFEAPFELRIFSIHDAIQIKIKDSMEVFASLKVAEIPLSIDKQVSQFI